MTKDHAKLRLTILQPEDENAWEKLVATSPLQSIYHILQWKRVLEESFGFKAQYIGAYRDGVMVGGLPLFSVKKPILGEKLISIPHSGGHSAFLSTDTSVSHRLIDFATGMARDRRVRYLEIRSREKLGLPALEVRQPLIFPLVPLCDTKTNLSQMSDSHRRSIRRARKHGLSVVPSYEYDDLRRFHEMMASQNQRFGSPMFPFKYFDVLWREFEPGRFLELLMIKRDGRLIGGGIFFVYKKKILYKYGACHASEMAASPYHAMLWRAIELGLERNLSELDLGAVSIGDKGLLRFKRHWGAEMTPANFHYLAVKGNRPKVEDYLDSYGWAKEVWRHLPKSIVKLVGPRILEWVC